MMRVSNAIPPCFEPLLDFFVGNDGTPKFATFGVVIFSEQPVPAIEQISRPRLVLIVSLDRTTIIDFKYLNERFGLRHVGLPACCVIDGASGPLNQRLEVIADFMQDEFSIDRVATEDVELWVGGRTRVRNEQLKFPVALGTLLFARVNDGLSRLSDCAAVKQMNTTALRTSQKAVVVLFERQFHLLHDSPLESSNPMPKSSVEQANPQRTCHEWLPKVFAFPTQDGEEAEEQEYANGDPDVDAQKYH